ncbi:Amino acid permease [Quillaja saponaria]|uniref:Amino acid permease n=1 Tax=Quillaja saponaria TaxID=32244 RepID=A0AAD7LX38_QUISA|nr:Amino acid permease [Quillaja saponaria]
MDPEIQLHQVRESDFSPPADTIYAEFDDDGKPKRTGTQWTAAAHIVTSVIGAGVLSLAWGGTVGLGVGHSHYNNFCLHYSLYCRSPCRLL